MAVFVLLAVGELFRCGGNLPWHLLFGVDGSHVTDTVAGGRLLMRDREIRVLDEAAIAREATAVARDVWARFAG